jgi:type II secretory pathway pseudopilin PulG
MSVLIDRRGATLADLLVLLAVLGLMAALLYPAWSAREFRARVSTAISDVEVVSMAARRALAASGRWPESASPGSAPPELGGLTGEGSPFSRTGYRVGWTSWNVVDSVAVPEPPPAPEDTPPESAGPVIAPVARSVGGVTVHSGDPALLAELTRHFGDEPTFVLDTMWLLVLTERAQAPVAER